MQLALAVTACRWMVNAMSDLDRRKQRVMPKKGGNIGHPAQLTILCDDWGKMLLITKYKTKNQNSLPKAAA